MLDRRTVSAIGHPVRVAILAELREHEMTSPSELAEKLDLPLGTVAYHFRRLAALRFIKLVKKVPRRGAMAHYYRLRTAEEPQAPEAGDVRSWLEWDNRRRDINVVLDGVAMGDLRVLVDALAASMQQLQAASVARAGVERAGPTFTVRVGVDVQRLPGTVGTASGER